MANCTDDECHHTFFLQRSFFLKLNATNVHSCHMKRIPRPRLPQFWNIWEITPEVRRRGGKQRMGGNMEISNFFIDTQLLFSFFGDAFFSSHICGQIFLFSCISGYKKYGILMYLHTDLYKSELYLCCEQSRVFVYFDICIFVDLWISCRLIFKGCPSYIFVVSRLV